MMKIAGRNIFRPYVILSCLFFFLPLLPRAEAATPCIKHDFVSGKSDPADATLIKPSDWNACHDVEAGAIKNADIGDGEIDLTTKVTGQLPAANIAAPVLDDSDSYCADAGSTDAYACSLSPAPAGYVTGARYRFKANTTNAGAATIDFNSLGLKTIKKVAGGVTTDLADNDIRAGQVVDLVYDGTNMQMQSLLGNEVSDAELSALAGLTSAADKCLNFSGAGAAAVFDCTGYGRSLLAAATEAAFKALVNLEPGTDFLAPNGSGAALTSLNASELASGTVPDARFPATLPALSGANLTALNAANLGSGAVPAARNTVAVLDGSVAYCADAGATDAYACSLSPAPAGYVTGARYRFTANTANTGAASINFNSLGAAAIKKAVGGITTDLADNDVRAGQVVDLVYDGTNMQMQSLLGNAASGSGDVVGPASATDNAIVLYDSTTGKLIKNSGCTIVSNVLTCPSGFSAGTSGTGVLGFLEGTAPGAGGSAGVHNTYFDSADSLLKSHKNGGSVVVYATVGGNLGAPTATTPSANDNDTSVPTTAYVQSELSAYASDAATFTNKTLDLEGTGNVVTIPFEEWWDAAGCDNATAGHIWNAPTSNAAAPTCDTGTNTQKAYLAFDAATDESIQGSFVLGVGFTGAIDIKFRWKAAATTGAVGWCFQMIRVPDGATGDPAFPAQAAGNCVSDTVKGTTLQENHAAILGATCTDCAASDTVYWRLSRDADGSAVTDSMTGDALLLRWGKTERRAL